MYRCPRIILLVFILSCCPLVTALVAQGGDKTVRDLTVDALHYAYNLDLPNAGRAFDKAEAADSEFCPARLYRSLPLVWKIFATRNQPDYDEFMRQIDRTLEITDIALEKNDRNADALFTAGMAYLYKAFVHARFDSYLKAAWEARKGYSYLKDCIRENPDYNDAYLGIGTIHYVTAMLPKTLRWMLSIMGVESDTQKGIREIERAAESGFFARTEARFYLGMYYGYLEEDRHGVDLLKSLSERYPDNVIFLYNLAGAELRQKQVALARDHFLKVVQYAKTDYDIMAAYSIYRLGECALRVNNFPEAEKWFLSYLQKPHATHFRSVALFRIGQCEEATGSRQKAVEWYGKSVSVESGHQEDRAALRRAQKALLTPMSDVGLSLLKADNLYYSGKFDSVVQISETLLRRSGLSDDEKGEIFHGLGRAFIDMNRLDEAAKILNRVFGLKSITETWIQPWTRYYLGVVAWKRGDNERAKQYLDLALDSDGYDYRMWLVFRAERLRERL